ncbi:MAG: hypothetical protein ACRDFC_10315 [Ignavibacteria bacterium]
MMLHSTNIISKEQRAKNKEQYSSVFLPQRHKATLCHIVFAAFDKFNCILGSFCDIKRKLKDLPAADRLCLHLTSNKGAAAGGHSYQGKFQIREYLEC